MIGRAKRWARRIGADLVAVYIAGRDARTPIFAKVLAAAVAAYALSPIDLIPDFIPVLGYLDDLVIVSLGIMLVVKLIPAELMAEYRRAASIASFPSTGRGAAMLVIAVWIALSAMLVAWAGWRFR